MKGSIFLLGFSLFPKWNFSKEKWNAEKRKNTCYAGEKSIELKTRLDSMAETEENAM